MRKSILLTSCVALCATASAASAADLAATVEINRPPTYSPAPTVTGIASPVTYYGYDDYGYGYRHGYYHPHYYRPYGYYRYHYGYAPHRYW